MDFVVVRLKRLVRKDTYTLGRLYLNGIYFCDTLEPPVNPKVGKGAIPYGVYDLRLTWSPKFKKMLPLLVDVPNFEGIRIHSGNTSKDTEGCILLGDNLKVGCVLNSTARVTEFIRLMNKKGNDFNYISITNEF